MKTKLDLDPKRHEFLKEINGLDPKANDIIKQMYSTIVDEGNENELPFIHFAWKRAIEEAYKDDEKIDIEQIRNVISNAFELLKTKKHWTIEEQELYQLTKELINISSSKKLNENNFDDKIADVTSSMVEFDFTKRVPILETKKTNTVFNFIANSINIVNEEMESNAISVRTINSLENLNLITDDIIITDKDYKIKHITKILSSFVLRKNKLLLGKSIGNLIEDFSSIKSNYLKHNEIVKNIITSIHFENDEGFFKKTPIKLDFSKIINENTNVIEGYLFKISLI